MKIFKLLLLLLTFAVIASGQKSETMTVKIYFNDMENESKSEYCSKVRAVTRTVPKTKAIAKAALEELFKGTTKEEESQGLSSVFNSQTASILKSVKVKNGAAYVNLNGWIIENFGNATTSCGSNMFDSEIEATLKQFPNIKKIFFAIDGSPEDFYNWMQIGECPKELKNCSGKDFK